MKSVIFNYYNILIDDINKIDENYMFYLDQNNYLISKINDLDIFLSVIKYSNNNIFYKILLTINNKVYFSFQDNNYCLLQINALYNYEYTLNELKFYEVNEKYINWGLVWSQRLDYYEAQIRELGKKSQEVLNSFSFYKGLAENAVLYYNIIINKYNNPIIGIVHYRIKSPNYELDYLNPTNLTFDYIVRDIAEYIKFYYFSDNNVDNVIHYLDNININTIDFNLLFCRLLYPTYYFDIYDNVLLNNDNNSNLYNVIDKTYDYLLFLNKIYNRYKDKYELLNVEWLNKIKM